MKISFCTTCSNRLYQLEQTFDANLAVIAREPEIEWVIVNLGSQDALHDFMLERLPMLPPNVIYAREIESRPWHMSVAKNIAHRAGSGDILFNLDCDNFIGNALEVLAGPLARNVRAVHLWSGTFGDGTCGRIAVARNLYYQLGGYDESFYPFGHEELDLLKRIRKSGLEVEHHACPPNSAVLNTKEEGIKYCAINGMTWKESTMRNRQQSEANLLAGKLVANVGREWGKAELTIFHGAGRSTDLKPILSS